MDDPETSAAMNGEPVSIIIPAYNEEASVARTACGAREALRDVKHEIIVVDDGSDDATAEAAEQARIHVIRHWKRKGYGAALKTGLRHAKHDVIVIMDADGQHDPADAPRLLAKMEEGYDMVVGARDAKSFQYAARMPGKRLLQWMAAFLVGERPEDVNSGLRVFRKSVAEPYFPILPNAFSFTTTLTLAMIKDAYRVGWLPIQAHPREGRRSTVTLADGLRTLLLILRISVLFNPLKVFLPISALMFAAGFGYIGWNLTREFNIPDGAVLALAGGAVIFFFGLLADQLASIRRIK
ncbi:MAG: glycosyltransferase [bacterium]|nr:glycosyltransferase [bacterium]